MTPRDLTPAEMDELSGTYRNVDGYYTGLIDQIPRSTSELRTWAGELRRFGMSLESLSRRAERIADMHELTNERLVDVEIRHGSVIDIYRGKRP